ncbi:MAG: hypothetical protein LBP32_01165, partial [Spirochaetaceae bacterium]|nr:hypothetical protein [Spirochaetaceae bacterium]
MGAGTELYRSMALFFASVRESGFDTRGTGNFLRCLRDLSGGPDLPVLRDIAALRAGAADPGGILSERLYRRYLRVCFVQEDLGRLDFKKAKPGGAFNEFVFDQIDFSVYHKIPEEDFRRLYIEGPGDLTDRFFEKTLVMGRDMVKDIISRGYQKTGSYYYV